MTSGFKLDRLCLQPGQLPLSHVWPVFCAKLRVLNDLFVSSPHNILRGLGIH